LLVWPSKLFFDGKPSINFHSIKDFTGQGADQNFFKSYVTTALPPPAPGLLQDVVLKGALFVFDQSLDAISSNRESKQRPGEPITLPQYEAAAINHDGSVVANPVEPWSVTFVPVAGLSTPSDSTDDFRKHLMEVKPFQSASPTAPVAVYQIQVQGDPKDSPKTIGTFSVTSPLYASKFCDEGLFFRHQTLRNPSGKGNSDKPRRSF